MFLKINHLFVYFLAWNFFHGKNFLHPKTERNGEKEKEATSDRRWGGESRVSSVYREPWNMMFLQSIVAFLRISGLHTRNITFRKLCLPIDMAGASSSSSPPPLTAGASVRVCVQIFHTHAPCVQLEIYQALSSSVFSQLPFSLRLSYSSILRFFRLLIYYVPKKNCYRWSIFKFFLD